MNKKAVQKEVFKAPCEDCGGRCCKYIVIEIDKPKSKKDFHYLRWYLLHKDVNVFLDHNNKWHIEFKTPCTAQTEDHSCSIYKDRPMICQSHGTGDGECEYYETPYSVYFSDLKTFEKYLDKKGIDWRFKAKK